MVVASVGADGRPSARVVLLKDFGPEGFVFFTNLESRKGQELLHHSATALLFYWPVLERQVRIEGQATRVTDEEADRYFASRDRGSQLGAWASLQSQTLESREQLEAEVAAFTKRFEGQPIPRPSRWSGLRVKPERMEFWHARPSRLHERLLFVREQEQWKRQLLYP